MAVFVPRMPGFQERKPSLATHSYCEGEHPKPYPPIEQPCTDQDGTGGKLAKSSYESCRRAHFSHIFLHFPPKTVGFDMSNSPKTVGSHDRFGQEQMEEMKERLDELKEMKDMMRLEKTIDAQ